MNGSGTGIASTLNQIVIGSSNTFNTRVINANMSLISISNVERTDLNISDRTNAICPEVDSNIICIAPLVNSMNMYHIGGS